jgi:hypothetical protein
MCTRARLVQGEYFSEWFGMPHATKPLVNVALADDLPAYLEVTVDPAAHGDAGLGPIRRAVLMKTASGEEMTFSLTADVLR